MRKNGIDKTLTKIDGGICAPNGFRACGVSLNENGNKNDVALIVSDKRFPSAAVFSSNALIGGYSLKNKAHLTAGYAQALLLYNGTLVKNLSFNEREARGLFQTLADKCGCAETQALIAPVGKIQCPLPAVLLEKAIDALLQSLGNTNEHSLAAAVALADTQTGAKQAAYSFSLGDVPCKIGAIFKGGNAGSEQSQATVCVLTTDVEISPQMLDKALCSAFGETFDMLALNQNGSPSDFVYITASGGAGNYRISAPDQEYKKFCDALKRVLYAICIELSRPESEDEKRLLCCVENAKSKKIAKQLCRAIVSSERIKRHLQARQADLEGILCALGAGDESIRLENTEIVISSALGEVVLWDFGGATMVAKPLVARVLNTDEIQITARLQQGNYDATALARTGVYLSTSKA